MIHSFLRLPKCYLLGYQYNLKFSYMCLIFFGTVWIPFFLFRVSPVEFGRGENILYTRKLNISSRNFIFKKKKDKKKIPGKNGNNSCALCSPLLDPKQAAPSSPPADL